AEPAVEAFAVWCFPTSGGRLGSAEAGDGVGEFVEVDGFGDDEVDGGAGAGDGVGEVAPAGDHADGQGGAAGFDGGGDLPAGHHGHDEIGEDELDAAVAVESAERFVAAAGRGHRVALAGQHLGERQAHVRLV